MEANTDYVALQHRPAAALVKRILDRVEQLIDHSDSGTRPTDFDARAIGNSLSRHGVFLPA